MESKPVMKSAPRLLIFDSGLGGLTVVRAIREAAPEALISYVADDAGFPYGALNDAALASRVVKVIGQAIEAVSPDAVVIACNTASTIALPPLRNSYNLPFIGTVPAVKPAAGITRTRFISVLATPATVRRDYTRDLISEHGQGCAFNLVGSDRLATIAERYAAGERVHDQAIAEEIKPCFSEQNGARTDVVVLACTHYPLIIERLERVAPWPVIWLDPAPAIARRAANVLADMGFVIGVGSQRPRGDIYFTSGATPTSSAVALISQYGLRLNGVEMPDEDVHMGEGMLWPVDLRLRAVYEG